MLSGTPSLAQISAKALDLHLHRRGQRHAPWNHLVIESENLEALRVLAGDYRGRIDVVYSDQPLCRRPPGPPGAPTGPRSVESGTMPGPSRVLPQPLRRRGGQGRAGSRTTPYLEARQDDQEPPHAGVLRAGPTEPGSHRRADRVRDRPQLKRGLHPIDIRRSPRILA